MEEEELEYDSDEENTYNLKKKNKKITLHYF